MRLSERNGTEVELVKLKWSGVERLQSWRVRHRAQAEACRYLARREWVRRERLSPTKRKGRLGDAGEAKSNRNA